MEAKPHSTTLGIVCCSPHGTFMLCSAAENTVPASWPLLHCQRNQFYLQTALTLSLSQLIHISSFTTEASDHWSPRHPVSSHHASKSPPDQQTSVVHSTGGYGPIMSAPAPGTHSMHSDASVTITHLHSLHFPWAPIFSQHGRHQHVTKEHFFLYRRLFFFYSRTVSIFLFK